MHWRRPPQLCLGEAAGLTQHLEAPVPGEREAKGKGRKEGAQVSALRDCIAWRPRWHMKLTSGPSQSSTAGEERWQMGYQRRGV